MVRTLRVKLNETQSKLCEHIGRGRRSNAIRNRMNPGEGSTKWLKPGDCTNDIQGAEGEWAASIALNVCYQPDIYNLDDADIGTFICVRSTDRANGCLIVKPDAQRHPKLVKKRKPDPALPFVLVIKETHDTFRIVGWMHADEARNESRYPIITDRGDPAHFVPQADLHDLASLIEIINTGRLTGIYSVDALEDEPLGLGQRDEVAVERA